MRVEVSGVSGLGVWARQKRRFRGLWDFSETASPKLRVSRVGFTRQASGLGFRVVWAA